MARDGERLPQVLVAEAHSSIERTRKMLQLWSGAGDSGGTVAMTAEEGPNPASIPHFSIRMYIDLDVHPLRPPSPGGGAASASRACLRSTTVVASPIEVSVDGLPDT
jgi:hypothetical protein